LIGARRERKRARHVKPVMNDVIYDDDSRRRTHVIGRYSSRARQDKCKSTSAVIPGLGRHVAAAAPYLT
jgi:hypothetical protein